MGKHTEVSGKAHLSWYESTHNLAYNTYQKFGVTSRHIRCSRRVKRSTPYLVCIARFFFYSAEVPVHLAKKYAVFEDCLLSPFKRCQPVGKKQNIFLPQRLELFEFKWVSQPYIQNTPAGNILLSASILFSGALPGKILRTMVVHASANAPFSIIRSTTNQLFPLFGSNTRQRCFPN